MTDFCFINRRPFAPDIFNSLSPYYNQYLVNCTLQDLRQQVNSFYCSRICSCHSQVLHILFTLLVHTGSSVAHIVSEQLIIKGARDFVASMIRFWFGAEKNTQTQRIVHPKFWNVLPILKYAHRLDMRSVHKNDLVVFFFFQNFVNSAAVRTYHIKAWFRI